MDESITMAKGPMAGTTGIADATLALAAQAHQAGRLAEAERLYRSALAAAPRHPQALTMLGVVLAQLGRAEEAVGFTAQAAKASREFGAHYNHAMVLRAAGRIEEAGRAFLKAANLNPRDPQLPWQAGVCLRDAGRLGEAAQAFDQVIKLDPASPEPWLQAGRAWLAQGSAAQGLARLREALTRFPQDEGVLVNACMALDAVSFHRFDPVFLAALTRWESLPDPKPVWFPARLLSLLKLDPALAPLIHRTAKNDLDSLSPLFGQQALLELMIGDLVPDPDFEILLLTARRLLTQAVIKGTALSVAARNFLTALALLCHASEYAFAEDVASAAAVESLAAGLDGASPPEMIAAIACHRPLARLPAAAALAARVESEADPLLARLLTRAVAEPLRERALQGGIVQLTAVDDAVSLSVAQQYDENPYPRWFQPPAASPASFAEALSRTFPHRAFPAAVLTPRQVLVAGCGSGWQAFNAARRYPQAEILAVDISHANLSHALRMQEKFGCDNVTFRRADIMRLRELGRSFDLIESNGVLHHMKDPEAGWAVLRDVLNPGGVMRIGLYSEVARRGLRIIEAFAKEQGFDGSETGLRSFRAAVLALPADHPVRMIVRSKEFYALSSLRDLAFHVNEHRFTMPSLKETLARLGLEFVGFELLYSLTEQLYRRRFPEDPAMTDLDRWTAFEENNPHSFSGCYDFWCAKPM